MKVIDVEQDYLGYAVHRPTGIQVTDQHTEIEMGAEESKRGKDLRCGGTEKGMVEQVEGWTRKQSKGGKMAETKKKFIGPLQYCLSFKKGSKAPLYPCSHHQAARPSVHCNREGQKCAFAFYSAS